MSAVTAQPFAIPTAEELEETFVAVDKAANAVEDLSIRLQHATATGGVTEPLWTFAATPTLADLGALWVFSYDVNGLARNLARWAAEIEGALVDLDNERREIKAREENDDA